MKQGAWPFLSKKQYSITINTVSFSPLSPFSTRGTEERTSGENPTFFYYRVLCATEIDPEVFEQQSRIPRYLNVMT
jgi:hypothetical protein